MEFYEEQAYYEAGQNIGAIIFDVYNSTSQNKPLAIVDMYRYYRNLIINLKHKSGDFDEQLFYNNLTTNISYYDNVVKSYSNYCLETKTNFTLKKL